MIVLASFQQTLWTVAPVTSGIVKIKAMGKSHSPHHASKISPVESQKGAITIDIVQ